MYSIHFLLNQWNGNDEEENDEDVNVMFEKFFSVEDLDFYCGTVINKSFTKRIY